ncbi:MAG: hypothetical protein ISR57_07555 [Bacteroidales bacterium]|nr:hypothetical protein [Bacteroidota bacterium]MBL6950485.1 hypothetical protein [Bacteroidales bacterium]
MMRTGVIVCVFIVMQLFQLSGTAQLFNTINQAEDSLKKLFSLATDRIEMETRRSSGQQFATLFYQTLEMQGSFTYPFDSLPTISKLTSPDNTFRLYTWNIPLLSGANTFYGAIQFITEASDSFHVIVLHDKSEEILQPEIRILSPQQWFGAIYYQVIPEQTLTGEVIYTLLGWHGENLLLTTRLIDILSISPSREVQFGKPMFCNYEESKPSRIIFRYAAKASMILRYEEQYIVTSKKWNIKRREYESQLEKAFVIVSDRLVPSDPQLAGQYEYYIPAGDAVDGFIFRDGCWHFIEDIDVRNPK